MAWPKDTECLPRRAGLIMRGSLNRIKKTDSESKNSLMGPFSKALIKTMKENSDTMNFSPETSTLARFYEENSMDMAN